MTDPEGRPANRRWTGRGYVHLLLPVAYLTAPAVALLDDAIGAADGWAPAGDTDAEPLLRRTWRRPPPADPADEIALTVLAWYPLIVTVGVVRQGLLRGRSARRAVRRTQAAALSVDGRLIGDRPLAHRLASGADRVEAADRLHHQAATRYAELATRHCGHCQAVTGYLATHCDGCGRRFTAADDAERAQRYRQATERLAETAAELDRLARDRPMRATPAEVG